MIKLFLLLLLFSFNLSFPQSDSIYSIIDYIQPDVFTSEDDINFFIESFTDNPIDLNKAEVKDLVKLPYITYEYAESILNFKENNNGFKDVSELFAISSIPKNIIIRISPFVKVETESKNDFPLSKFGYTGKLYKRNNLSELQINDYKILNRFAFSNIDDIKGGLILEKDAGENNFNDYSSFHLEFNDILSFDKIIIGDYNVEFGEGLVNWSYTNYINSSAFYYFQRSTFKPHSYVNENLFYRGISASTSTKYLNFNFFFSNNKHDAELDSSNNFVKFISSGLHKSSGSINNKDNITETAFGTILKYQPLDNFQLGFLFGSSILNKHDVFQRKSFTNYSVYYDWILNDIKLNGEISSDKIRTAFIQRLRLNLSGSIMYNAAISNIPDNYLAYHRRKINRNNSDGLNISNGFTYFSPVGELNFNLEYLSNKNYSDESNLSFSYFSNKFYYFTFVSKYFKYIDNYTLSGKIFDKHIILNELNYFLDYQTKLKSRFEYYLIARTDNNTEGHSFINQIDHKLNDNFTFSFRYTFFNQKDERLFINLLDDDFGGNYFADLSSGTGTKWYFSLSYKFLTNYKVLFYYAQTRKNEVVNNLNMVLNMDF